MVCHRTLVRKSLQQLSSPRCAGRCHLRRGHLRLEHSDEIPGHFASAAVHDPLLLRNEVDDREDAAGGQENAKRPQLPVARQIRQQYFPPQFDPLRQAPRENSF